MFFILHIECKGECLYIPIKVTTRTAKQEIPANNIRDSVILLPTRLFKATTKIKAGISTKIN